MRNDIAAQHEANHSNESGRNHVGFQQAVEAHSIRPHGDDFRVVGQFGREEDNGYKNKQRTEQIGEVGNEVQVIGEHDFLPRCMTRCKLVDAFVVIEHNYDGNNQDDGEDKGADKFLDDIPVEFGEPRMLLKVLSDLSE